MRTSRIQKCDLRIFIIHVASNTESITIYGNVIKTETQIITKSSVTLQAKEIFLNTERKSPITRGNEFSFQKRLNTIQMLLLLLELELFIFKNPRMAKNI